MSERVSGVDWFDSLDWVPTLRPRIETAWVGEDGGYWLARWADATGLLRWIHADGETREAAMWELIEMAPDIMLTLHDGEDRARQEILRLRVGTPRTTSAGETDPSLPPEPSTPHEHPGRTPEKED